MICSKVFAAVAFFLHAIAFWVALIALVMAVQTDYGKCSYSYFKPRRCTHVALLLLVAGAIIVTITMIYSFCSIKVGWYLRLLVAIYWMIFWIPILFLWLGVSPQRKGLLKAGVVLAFVSYVVSRMWYRAFSRINDGCQQPNGDDIVETRDTRFFSQV